MALCPNKNLQDWSDLVSKLGEDGAYYVFMKNGGKVPYLQGRGSNRFIWDVENKHGLISWKSENGKNTKLYKGFSRDAAANKVSEIREEYVGDYGIAHIAPDTAGEYGLRIQGYPLPRKEVEEHAIEFHKSNEEAIRDLKQLKELEDRMRESNEHLIPPEHYDQTNILHDDKPSKVTTNEFESLFKVNQLESILRQSMPQITEVVYDRNLEVNGRLQGSKIIINPDTMTRSTIGHEFAHMLIDLRGGISNSFIKQAIDQLKGTELEAKVRKAYEGLPEDQIQKEILAEAIGTEVANIFEEDSKRSAFEQWLIRFFRWLNSRTGLSKDNARAMANTLMTGREISADKFKGVSVPSMQDQVELESIDAETIDTRVLDKPLEEMAKLRDRAADIISTRIRKAHSTGRVEDVHELENVLQRLEAEDVSDLVAVFGFVRNAVNYVNGTYKVYEERLEKERTSPGDGDEAFSIHMLNRWNDILSSYDILDDISKGLMQAVSNKVSKSELKGIRKLLLDTIEKKNTLRDLYLTKGAEMATNALERYNSHIIIATKDLKRQEWVEKNKNSKLSREERRKKADEYAEDYIKKNINKLGNDAKNMLRSQMENATEDIGLLSRWLDTLLDTNDMMMAAMVKKFVVKHGESRKATLDFRNDAWPIVQAMYKQAGYKYLKTPPENVYDYMLERDEDGNRTGYYVTKFRSSLLRTYRTVLKETEMLPEEERYEARRKWKEDNMPLDKQARNSALKSFLREMELEGDITAEEIENYNLNLQRPFIRRFKLDQIINKEAADRINKWHMDNTMEFRNPDSKWINPQWGQLSGILANDTDPRAQFYNLIVDYGREVDSQLSFAKRKMSQLPFKIKTEGERIATGQKVSDLAKETFEGLTQRRADDIERGQYTDENDKPIDYLPWYYQRPGENNYHIFEYTTTSATGVESRPKLVRVKAETAKDAEAKFKRLHPEIKKYELKFEEKFEWTDKDQSYDLMGLYYSFFKMANHYTAMHDILPEMELVKRLAENRKYTVTDPKGNPIQKVVNEVRTKALTKEGAKSLLVQQYTDFMKAMVYGQGKEDEGQVDFLGFKFDKAKMLDNLGKYSAYNMLGLNLIQGVANVNIGEMNQVIEAAAGEFFNLKDLHKATVEYGKEMPNVMGDVGLKKPESKLGLLNERWDILNEYENGNFRKNSRFAELMSSSALFFTSHLGEHFMQSRVLIAMMKKREALDKDGNVLGNMYDMYKVVGGKLELDPKVDEKKSGWTLEQQELFGAKVKRVLARLHGEYSDIGKNAAQRWAIGRLAMMFRKFVVPGFKRRYGKKVINTLLDDYTEGSYRTMGRYIKQSILELRALQLSTFSENWKVLQPREQDNIIRGALEFGFGFALMALSGMFLTLKGDADDEAERAVYATMALLAMRARAETFFFSNPAETLTIIKNPAVATSTIENIIKLVGQMFAPLDTYERGSWKDNPKIVKTIVNMTPGVKQYYKIKNIEDALTFFIK